MKGAAKVFETLAFCSEPTLPISRDAVKLQVFLSYNLWHTVN